MNERTRRRRRPRACVVFAHRRDTHGAAVPRVFKMARPSCVRLSSLRDLSVWERETVLEARRAVRRAKRNKKIKKQAF